VIYSYNESQGDALFLKFITVKNSKYFGHTVHHQESQHCINSSRYLSYSYVDCLLAEKFYFPE
jgi:hypothetical protein